MDLDDIIFLDRHRLTATKTKQTKAKIMGTSPVYWLANLTHDLKVVGLNLVLSKYKMEMG